MTWLLIKVKEPHDVGKNECRRILCMDDDQIELNVIPFILYDGRSYEVHPATEEER